MFDVAHDVLPVFLFILLGWLLVATRYLKPEAGVGLSDFVFKLAVPVLIFRTLAEADFHGAFPVRLWLAYFGGVIVTWAAGHLVSTRLFGSNARIGTVAGVSSAFANNVFIGLPLVERVVGAEGLVAVSILLAVHLPVMMLASSLLMERFERQELGATSVDGKALIRYLAINLTRNPLIFGVALGSAWHLTGVPLSGVPKTLVDQISAMAGPAALISLGMAMHRHGFGGDLRMSVVASAFKLLLLPASVLVFAHLLGLSPAWQAALVLTSSVPTGVNAWLIASQFATAERLAASTITITTALGVLTVTFWAWFMG